MTKQISFKNLCRIALLPLLVGQSATGLDDFASLYKSKNYAQICKTFEANQATHWSNPESAYYYALGLAGLGKKHDAINVCRSLSQRYPKTKAGELARSAIKLWSTSPKSTWPFPHDRLKTGQPIGIIGLKFKLASGLPPTIERVFQNTPAYKAGLKTNDIIIKVNGFAVVESTKEEIQAMIVGPPNSNVNMTFLRDGNTFEKQLKRMSIDALKTSNPDVYRDYLMSR